MLLGNTCERHWGKQGNVYAGRGLLTLQLRQLTFFRAAGAVQYFAFSAPLLGVRQKGRIRWGWQGCPWLEQGIQQLQAGKVVRRSSNCDSMSWLKSRSGWTLGQLSMETPTFLGGCGPRRCLGGVWSPVCAAGLSAVPEDSWKMWKCSVPGEGSSRC